MEIIIEVNSLPPVEFSPNARVHWAKRYKAGKQYKQEVYYNALQAITSLSKKESSLLPLPYAEMSLLFVVGEERIRDENNWVARFKPGQDALIFAGIIAFDDMKHLKCKSISFEVNRGKAPKTIIKIKEVSNDKARTSKA